MANYNILMNRFNGTTHDTLLPKNSLEGTTNPTTSTVGIVGQFYLNTATKQLFQCSTVSGSVYTWVPFYNATQTLDNTTKAKYGLANTATPNDAFDSLATNMVATRKTYPVKAGNSIVAGDVVDVVGGEITNGFVSVSTLPVGTIIKLNENGSPVDYIIINQGLPSAIYDASCNGTWVVRKDSFINKEWNTPADSTDYANSTIKAYLDSTFYNQFDTIIKSKIKQVKIPYRVDGAGATVNSGANGLSCNIFLLSAYELGWTTANSPVVVADGAKLSYFDAGDGGTANTKRIAYFSGSPTPWWARSPSSDSQKPIRVTAEGKLSNYYSSYVTPVRPALVLDSSYFIKTTVPSQAIALQSGTSPSTIEIIYDGVAPLSGITAGTQITSAGVQGHAPQDGWLWVWPKVSTDIAKTMNFYTPIKSVVTTVSTQQIDVDISDINFSDYEFVEIFIRGPFVTTSGLTMRFNNVSTSGAYYSRVSYGTSETAATGFVSAVNVSNGGGLWVKLMCASDTITGDCGYSSVTTHCFARMDSGYGKFSTLTTMNLIVSGSSTFPAGTKIKFYGVKK